jgi:hypothetical protein
VPALVKVWEKVCPGLRTALVFQAGGVDVDITEWPVWSTWVHVTVPPTLTVTVGGEKEKLTILTEADVAAALGVVADGVVADGDVADGDVAAGATVVGVLVDFELEPQAPMPRASTPTAPTAVRRLREMRDVRGVRMCDVRVITDCTYMPTDADDKT